MSRKTYDEINPDIKAKLKALERLVTKKLDENPKSGVILHKGTSREQRVRYKELMDFVHAIDLHLGRTGLLSMGSCRTCAYCDKTCHSSRGNVCGMCTIKKIPVDDLTCCTKYNEVSC